MQTLNYRGTKAAYTNFGEGKPLIFLHGWGVNSSIMKPLAEQLSAIRTCYLLDLPGFGESSPPPEAWSIDDYADFVEFFMDQLDISGADLIAHSFGGRIALKLCGRNKNRSRIEKVLLTGGAGMKPRRSFSFYVKKYAAKMMKVPFLLLPGRLRNRYLKKLRSTRLWKTLGSSDYTKLEGVMRKIFVKTVTEHLDYTLPSITHEVLLLWGEEDQATPLYQARRMEKGIEHAALVTIEGAGHYAFLDRPERFTRIARAFFTG